MCGSVYKRGDYVWVQDVRANFVCIHNGELVATVFATQCEPWQVILHHAEVASILKGEFFQDPQAAMSRAEGILEGTSASGSQLVRGGFAEAFTP